MATERGQDEFKTSANDLGLLDYSFVGSMMSLIGGMALLVVVLGFLTAIAGRGNIVGIVSYYILFEEGAIVWVLPIVIAVTVSGLIICAYKRAHYEEDMVTKAHQDSTRELNRGYSSGDIQKEQHDEAKETQAQLDRLIDMAAQGLISTKKFKEKSQALEKRLADLQDI